jgi:formate hydrogenlyase subunit 6/NADH:ubiquinone oxidoreductase subunit I
MMQDIWQSFFKRPITQRYPFERLEAPDHFRGKLHWDPAKCNGCSLCSKDCPSNAIEVVTIDKKAKRFVMRYHADRCTYCGQCVKNCRLECLGMSNREWELAALTRKAFVVHYGNEADVEALLANAGQPSAPPAGAPAPPAN